MDRITFILLCLFLFSCHTNSQKSGESTVQRFNVIDIPNSLHKVEKSEDEWKMELSDFEFFVLRKKGTERAFSGEFWNNKKEGVYLCAGCGLPLFESDTKYRSGTGWPSYYQPIKPEFIKEDEDYLLGYKRVEVLCARCDGHLGHVFEDGPKPTGLRYCINSISLDFIENKE